MTMINATPRDPAAIRRSVQKRIATLQQRYGVSGFNSKVTDDSIRMVITDWFIDEADGCPTRYVRAEG